MPHIDVSLNPGRSPELKSKIAKGVQEACAEALGMDKENISVSLSDTNADTFVEDIFKKVNKESLVIESNIIKK